MIKWRIPVCLSVCFLLHEFAFAQSNTLHTRNIKAPVRVAFLPGVSTQGRNDIYTTSNFSLNILGGSTAGINGLELGSLFNFDTRNVHGVQSAGLFNMTGGSVKGLQMAGLCNTVKGNFSGVQSGGLVNYIAQNAYGIQKAGLYNQTAGNFTGLQAAGIANYTREKFRGLQLAGIANINNSTVTGFQAAGVFNYTKHLKGVQLGLINVADTSDGFSIGLINIVKKGYHKIAISSNEVLNTNIAIKSGNAKLYNILFVGINAGQDKKSFSYGYGIGHEIKLGSRFALNPELTTQYLYLGSWHYFNSLSKLQLQASINLAPGIAFFAGPSFAVYYTEQPAAIKGYKFNLPSDNYHAFDLWNNNVKGWVGFAAGINFL
jgi:hypothetical protein